MKIFQIRFLMVTILSFSIIGSSILFPNSLAQEDTQVPSWVKNVAEWWADDQVSEKEFLAAIEYLINNNIISLALFRVECLILQLLSPFQVGLKTMQSGGLKI